MDRVGNHLYLEVPGLAENRPSVLRGDRLFVHLSGDKGRSGCYEGFVHQVRVTNWVGEKVSKMSY